MESDCFPFVNADFIKESHELHLPNNSLIKRQLSCKLCTNILTYSWSVGSYDELKNSTLYEHITKKLHYSCTFRLKKIKKILWIYVLLSGSLMKTGTFQLYIRVTDKETSTAKVLMNLNPLDSSITRATEEQMGKFVAKFPEQNISKCCHQSLNIVFYFVFQPREKLLQYYTGKIDIKLASVVSSQLFMEMSNSRFADFQIVALHKTVFLAHRGILAVRSKYFSKHFIAQKEVGHIDVDAFPGIVFYVLQYIYSGQIDVLDTCTMLKVFNLAHQWEIVTLMESCANNLKGKIEPNHEKQIADIGLELTYIELLEIMKRLDQLTL